ncbi:DegT/DnrJ/EryC1/StrS aminotransferase family protein [Prochlorococcus sp. AH-716-G10]|nr:DegT/DnrJ/EryC1/StrS aminotransferase family protein [Prochlorococcus sp. AH-716-G10]
MDIASWPFYDEEQINAAKNVLLSGKVNKWTGTECDLFEKEYSSWCGSKYSVSVSNGSSALSLAYSAIGLKEGDEFITTPRTFIATSSCGAMLGAKPVFADVDRNSGSITAKTIEPLINKKTKAISLVHLGGWPAEIEKICQLAKSYNLFVIEDCSQAHGAKIVNQHVGTFGDIATWSFCQDKIISTGGEGGMVTTNNEELYSRVWSLKDHGKNQNLINIIPKTNNFRYIHDYIGTNMRLTEFQASIGRVQLKLISKWNKLRARNAKILFDSLKEFSSLRIPYPKNKITHAWYRFYTYVDKNNLNFGWDRDRLIYEINKKGVPAFTGSCSEIYLEKCLRNFDPIPPRRLKIAKNLGETSLCFLIHPTIDLVQINYCAEAIGDVFRKASK